LDPPETLAAYARPVVRGRDVRPFRANPTGAMLWPADAHGDPWSELPDDLAEYLTERIGVLSRRADLQRGPWWQLFRTRAATAPHRTIWCDLAPSLRATTLADTAAVPINSCYVAAMPSASTADALVAWLNSTWIGALARIGAEPAAGGCARFGARAVGAV